MSISISLVPEAGRTSGFAPHGVFFDASATTSTATSRPFHDLIYIWDFGDPAGGATWAYGARPNLMSKNTAYGPVAGHLFESAGTFTVRLWVYDGTTLATTTTTITVTDADTFFSGANTICVRQAATGTFGGAPSGATQVTESSWATAISTYATDGKRVLFRNGDTWGGATATLAPSGTTGGLIGSFGTDSAVNPIILSSAAVDVLSIGSGANTNLQNWVIMDLEFDGAGVATRGVTYGGDNDSVTYLRMHIHDFIDIGIEFNQVEVAGNHVPIGQYTVDCHIHDIADFAMIGGTDKQFVAGCNMHDCPAVSSHVFRNSLFRKAAITNNDFVNGGNCLTMRAVTFTDVSPVYPAGTVSEYGYVGQNRFQGGTANGLFVGLASFQPATPGLDQRVQNCIFEGNWQDQPSASPCGGLVEVFGTDITVRNNFADQTGAQIGGYLVLVGQKGGEPAPSGINIYNNTGTSNNSNSGYFGGISCSAAMTNNGGTTPNNIKNNLFYAPADPNPGEVTDNSGSATVSNNTSNSTTNPNFTAFPWTTLTDAYTTSSSYTWAAGTTAPLYTDGFGRSRVGVTLDIGAYQHTEGTYPWESATSPTLMGQGII